MALFLYLRLQTEIRIDVLNDVFYLINKTAFLFLRQNVSTGDLHRFYLLVFATYANLWQNTKGFFLLSKIHFRGNIKLFLFLHRFFIYGRSEMGNFLDLV
ncbi:hypothetical protein HV269_24245 [Citrobacter sp. RHBSTW-00696]|uniref:hypothetical protein n=1 Tax=Citrobacter TaxID=544 RepID=UPI0015E9944E|nr:MULTISPECIES: hypothetical protein [Citrobacter]MBA8085443.1 hypothetical protein [Citrobacter sp. RHBSTW-00089]MBD9974605.1 hypothetical protein [Citrobacter braakii]MBS9487715.1 hypothetical protein [Citrobacter braakii]MDE9658467.1 hypothetical protein [Citrobacter braakii]MEC3927884.1 hypothetical protein [Citrobacter braakii]